MNKLILTGTAIATLSLMTMGGAIAEEVTKTTELQGQIPPAMETENKVTSFDEMLWGDLPAAEIQYNDTVNADIMADEGQKFIPVEDTAEMMPRSGFDNPVNADDLNALETAAGGTVSNSTGMDSSLGFEDPSIYADTTDDGSDLVDIMPAAGHEDGGEHDMGEHDMDAHAETDAEMDAEVNATVDMMEDEMGDTMDASEDMAEETYDETTDMMEEAGDAMEEATDDMDADTSVEADAEVDMEAVQEAEEENSEAWEGIDQ
jgi:hypothetical protein